MVDVTEATIGHHVVLDRADRTVELDFGAVDAQLSAILEIVLTGQGTRVVIINLFNLDRWKIEEY